MRFLPSVKIALIVFFTLTVGGLTGTVFLLAHRGWLGPTGVTMAGPSPKDAAAGALAFINERFENLAAKALAFTESSPLREALNQPQPNPAQVADVIRELMPETNTVLLVATGRNGNVLFDSRGGNPASPWPLASESIQGTVSRAFLSEGSQILQYVSAPVRASGRTIGTVTVMLPVDMTFASLVKSLTGNEVALFMGNACVNTTSSQMSPSQATEILRPRLPGGAKAVPAAPSLFGVDLKDGRYDACYVSLNGPKSPNSTAYLVLLKPVTATPVWQVGWPLWAAGGLWLALGLFFALWTARIAARPLKRIEQVIERAELGDLKGVVEVPGAHEAAPLAHTVNRFVSNWQERELFKNILGKYAPQSSVKKLLASGEPPALEGERRTVVMLACGIRGFSAFTENADPAKLSRGLNDFFTLMSNIVFKHEGFVDKFVGDSFLAVWGAPLPQEDAEMSAVKAALEMQDALRDFNAERVKQNLHPMMVGIGIVTGEVVVGNLGSEQNPDYTVIGEEVALVMKLSSKAQSGQIVVADSAFQKVKDRVEVNPLAPIVQKGIAARGFSEPVKIHVVTDLKT